VLLGGIVVFNFLQRSKLPLALWERVGVRELTTIEQRLPVDLAPGCVHCTPPKEIKNSRPRFEEQESLAFPISAHLQLLPNCHSEAILIGNPGSEI
jgi:hypothetical protein